MNKNTIEAEPRNRTIQVLTTQSTAKTLKAIAQLEGDSMNNIINSLLNGYIKRYKSKGDNRERLKTLENLSMSTKKP